MYTFQKFNKIILSATFYGFYNVDQFCIVESSLLNNFKSLILSEILHCMLHYNTIL